MKLTPKENVKDLLSTLNSSNLKTLGLPFELEINDRKEDVTFWVFASIPFVEEINGLLEKNNFKIMLIDDGSDIEFEKIDSGYSVLSTSDRTNKEVVNTQDIKDFVISYWKDLSNLLGDEVIQKIKEEINNK
ncbi:MAG: hypothetical protein ACMG57_05860 [Candidatus Dojkabacteria bacterium]